MSTHYCQQGKVKPTHYVVNCKQCKRAIPAGLNTSPKTNQIVACALCGEIRQYRPSEVYLGFPDSLLDVQQTTITQRRRGGWSSICWRPIPRPD